MLFFPTLLAAIFGAVSLVEAKVRLRDDCKSNAECLRQGRRILTPRRYYDGRLGSRAANSFYGSCTVANSTGAIETFQPLTSGPFILTIQGSYGPGYNYNGRTNAGGAGASFTTTLSLDSSETYSIVIGCPGTTGALYGGAGGGGGSFVWTTSSTTLLAAAGGGGSGSYFGAAKAASSDFSGAGTTDGGNYGTASTGGQGGTVTGSQFAGGAGAGWLSDGGRLTDTQSGGGGYAISVARSTQAYGGAGGIYPDQNGGVGGYGGGGGSSSGGGSGAGGGGYSGGNGGSGSGTNNNYVGGGGGGNYVISSATGTSAITLVGTGGLVSIQPQPV